MQAKVDKKSALVTGAGICRQTTAERLVAEGYSVTVSDLRDPQIAGARFVKADITSRAACEQITAGVASVFTFIDGPDQAKRCCAVWAESRRNVHLVVGGTTGWFVLVYLRSSASVVYQRQTSKMATRASSTPAVSQAPHADSKIAAERDVIEANGKGRHADLSLRPTCDLWTGDGRFPAIPTGKAGALRLGVGTKQW